MIGKKIQKFIVKEVETFYEEYKKLDLDESNDELVQKLIDHLSIEKKKTKKESSEEERCQAITSKKTQCTSKKFENDLCKLHLKKGTAHGIIGGKVSYDKDEPEENNKGGCQHMFKKGKLASQTCGKKTEEETLFCKKHMPAKSVEIIPVDEYSHEETTVEENADSDNSDDF